MSGPTSTAAYQALRLRIRASAPPICWLCSERIDLTLRWPHRLSWSLDHVIPLARGGSLLDPANARPAHLACNCKRQDDPPPRIVVSRQW
jgi:5-methylcytosine-specific restriction endonuclease McrA